MFQKALKIAATLGLLLIGYAGYVQGFAVLMSVVGKPRGISPIPLSTEPTPSAQVASELSLLALGPNHWSNDPKDPPNKYYDASRGYWMYFRDYESIGDKKKLRLFPFLIIWKSKSDNALKTMTAQEAIVEFDQPLQPGQPGSAHVVKARINGAPVIRNNKGTPDESDDLVIDQLTYLEFDEKKLEISADSPVRIKDKGFLLTGETLLIGLHPKNGGQGGGFDPRTATLLKNIRIVMDDVGRSGIVPVSPATTMTVSLDDANAPGAAGKRVPKPGQLDCRGPMVVTLPPNRRPVKVGPPAPKGPTIADFSRNVVVRQGIELPDQLDADHLTLTLIPAEKVAKPPRRANADDVPTPAPAPSGDTLGSLALSSAHATGHAVWLQSPSQGMKALGQELIYTRLLPEAPDKSYFRGDKVTKVEKITYVAAGPDKGKIQSIDVIETVDITIYQSGPEAGPPTMVARGPGTLETRADRNKPVDRFASWEDQLEVYNVGTGAESRRKITLLGPSTVSMPSQGNNTISAREKIVAYLRPDAKSTAKPELEVDGQPLFRKAEAPTDRTLARNGGSGQIEWVVAEGDVVLETSGKTATASTQGRSGKQRLEARKRLDVVFVPAPQAQATAPAPAQNVPAPVQAAPADGPAVAQQNPPAEGAAATDKAAEDPPMIAKGDTAWARIQLVPDDPKAPAPKGGPAGSPRGIIEKAFLRGNVTVHQDATAGKKRGTDLTANKIDMKGLGDGLSEFQALGTPAKHAEIISDGFTIKGELLGLNQAEEYAWVKGAGTLIQEKSDDTFVVAAKTGDEVRLERPDPKAAATKAKSDPSKPRGPVTITWGEKMEFFGRTNPDQRGAVGPAKAVFHRDVHVKTEDSTIDCRKLTAMFDAPVSFRKKEPAPRDPKAEADEKTPNPKIVWVKCLGDPPPKGRPVRIVRRDVDPANKLLKGKDRLDALDVFYDLVTGDFEVLGQGEIRRYSRKEEKGGSSVPFGPRARPAPIAEGRQVRPVADTPKSRAAAKAQLRNRPQAKAAPKPKEARPKAPKPEPLPLEMSRINFSKAMKGRFGGGTGAEEGKPKGPSQANFWGDILVLHAPVADENADLDPDAFTPPPGLMRFNCKTLQVDSLPATEGSQDPDHIWMTAWRDVSGQEADRLFRGDRMSYDSAKELYWIYGDEGRLATITQQPIPGATFSSNSADAIMVNRKSGETRMLGARDAQLVDPRSGTRLGPAGPSLLPDVRKPRVEPKLPSRADKERQGFRGR